MQTDGQLEVMRLVKRQHFFDVGLGDDVAIANDAGRGWSARKKAEGATSAEGFGFAKVDDFASEFASVAEVIFNDVGEVADREEDFANTEADEVEDEAFENGATGDAQHGFRDMLGDFAKPTPASAGHDDGPVGTFGGTEQFLEKMNAGEQAVGVDNGDLFDAHGLHEVEDVSARGVFADANDVRVDEGRYVAFECEAGEDGTPEVTVGEGAAEQAVGIGDEQDACGAVANGNQGFAEGCVPVEAEAMDGAFHVADDFSMGRAGTPTTVMSAGTFSTTAAPSPTIARGPMWTPWRTEAPAPMWAISPT